MLEGGKRNRDMFMNIFPELQNAGFEMTGEQCNCKRRKLKLDYRKIKDERRETGIRRKEWKFFKAMDCVLGHKPATQLLVVVESGETSSTTNPVAVDEVEEHTVDKPDDSASSNSSNRSVTSVHVYSSLAKPDCYACCNSLDNFR